MAGGGTRQAPGLAPVLKQPGGPWANTCPQLGTIRYTGLGPCPRQPKAAATQPLTPSAAIWVQYPGGDRHRQVPPAVSKAQSMHTNSVCREQQQNPCTQGHQLDPPLPSQK